MVNLLDLLRLGRRGTDPLPPESEGAVYWNTDSKSIRVYDGSAWTDVGGGGATGPAPLIDGGSPSTPTTGAPVLRIDFGGIT